MELSQAHGSIGLTVWFRRADLPAAEPRQVRIMSTSSRFVRASVQLDGSVATSPDDCFDVDPEELHFERSAFDPDPPSSGSRATLPAPPPDFDSDPPTSRSPPSAPHTDRPVVIDIVSTD